MNKTYLTKPEISVYRKEKLQEQQNVDPIINQYITSPVLDHCHSTGHCRSALQREVNSFEGVLRNAFKRYLGHLVHEDEYSTILANLSDYWLKDFSSSPLHPGELDKDVKRFKKLSSMQQKTILKEFSVEDKYLGNNKTRAVHARRLLKNCSITKDDLVPYNMR